jgi:hypothetical protein
VKVFANYSKDFRALEDSLQGDELEEVEFLDGVAITVEDRLHAANSMLEMYDSISCKPDRAKARPILKKQLDYYSQKRNCGGQETCLRIKTIANVVSNVAQRLQSGIAVPERFGRAPAFDKLVSRR